MPKKVLVCSLPNRGLVNYAMYIFYELWYGALISITMFVQWVHQLKKQKQAPLRFYYLYIYIMAKQNKGAPSYLVISATLFWPALLVALFKAKVSARFLSLVQFEKKTNTLEIALEVNQKWTGWGMEVGWKWAGSGLEVAWKWAGSGLGMGRKQTQRRLEAGWKHTANVYRDLQGCKSL